MRGYKKKLTVGVATLGLVASLGVTPAMAMDASRLAGGDRVATAVQVASHAFAGQKPEVVYVAGSRDANLVDATTAGKLADGPLLYVPSTPAGAAQLGQTLAASPVFSGVKRVVAIGGSASVHEVTLQTLATALKSTQVSRLAGADRYETAVEIAKYVLAQAKAGNKAYAAMLAKDGSARAVYVANGDNKHLVDSMVAGTLGDGPTLLVRPDGTLPEAAKALLAELKPQNVTGLGGASAISDATLQLAAAVAGAKNTARLGGTDRFATAAQVAQRYFQVYGTPAEVYVATGGAAADAIIGGQPKRGPILLVAPNGATPAATSQALRTIAKQAGRNLKLVGLGGQSSLPETALKAASDSTSPHKATDKKPSSKPSNNNSSSSGSSGSSNGSGAGSSGGSSAGSSGGSSAGSGTAKPAPVPSNPSKPPAGLYPQDSKTTLNADNSESVEATLRIGTETDTRATAAVQVQLLSPKANDSDMPLVVENKTGGVYLIKTTPSTTAGRYRLTVTTSDNRTADRTITVVKKHTTPPKFIPGTGVSNQGGNNIVIATVEGGKNDATWLKLKKEVAVGAPGTEMRNAFEFDVTANEDIITAQEQKSIKDSLSLDYENATLRANVPKIGSGNSFKVSIKVKAHGFYLESNPITVSVAISS